MILRLTESRQLSYDSFSEGADSHNSLYWVFELFERLADQCSQTIRLTGPSLIEFGALARAILEIEQNVNFEKKIWNEFQIRMTDRHNALPNPANYNILTLARQAVRFVDVIDDREHYEDPENEAFDPYKPPAFLRSPEWGEWR